MNNTDFAAQIGHLFGQAVIQGAWMAVVMLWGIFVGRMASIPRPRSIGVRFAPPPLELTREPLSRTPTIINQKIKMDNHNEAKPKQVTIYVNTRPHEWDKKDDISFQEVVTLAFGSYIDDPKVIYTVKYFKGPDSHKEGSLHKGESVKIKNGMIFDVTQTGQS
ncbi:MAG: multiubiquitin domain-containing protein [Patescibacteria group bacterium]|nr:multiubiquitin domain-containing protein [Patescibacteria group bacterium]